MTKVSVIIHTDKYSGNFERELCAYVTGLTNESRVGDEIACETQNNLQHFDWWDENADFENLVEIWPTPGYINNGMGKHYLDTPENRILAAAEKIVSLEKYHSGKISMLQQKINEKDFDLRYTEETCSREIQTILGNIESEKINPSFYEAYQSVIIRLINVPPTDVSDEMIKRVKMFCQKNDLTLLGIDIETTIEKIQKK